MKITPHIVLLILAFMTIKVHGQNIYYFKVTNIDNGLIISNSTCNSDSKKTVIRKTKDGIFEVKNLKNNKTLIFEAKDYESKHHSRPKKRVEISRKQFNMFVLEDRDTLTINLLPNDKMLKKCWENEDSLYGAIDTLNCNLKPHRRAMPIDSIEFNNAIMNNIYYPQQAIEDNLQGKVIVGAVIELDGRITNVHIKRGIDPHLDRAALRTIRKINIEMSPAIHNGNIVRSIILIPLNFELN